MKVLLNTILICLMALSSMAHESYPERSDWEVVSKIKDSTLKKGRTRITFQISGVDLVSGPQRLVWSANKFIDTTYIGMAKDYISDIFISGNYNFKFYVSNKYREIIIPKLYLDSGYSITVQLNFKSSQRQNMMVKKPVIYLYPTEPTAMNVRVEPKGEMSFTYPFYDVNGWDFTAFPNGDLAFCYQKLDYLFWEAEQEISRSDFDLRTGSLVTKENTVTFLDESLTAFGMNSKEKADFITFWGPQLQKNDQNFIHFVLNEEAEIFADLMITPKPDRVYRFYMVYHNADGMTMSEVQQQAIPAMDRSGFTVLEWGGTEIPEQEL